MRQTKTQAIASNFAQYVIDCSMDDSLTDGLEPAEFLKHCLEVYIDSAPELFDSLSSVDGLTLEEKIKMGIE